MASSLLKGIYFVYKINKISLFNFVCVCVCVLIILDYFSVGITRYLCREFKVDDHWYPSDSKEQAKVDEYLEWQHLNTRLHCSAYFLAKVNAFSMSLKCVLRAEYI